MKFIKKQTTKNNNKKKTTAYKTENSTACNSDLTYIAFGSKSFTVIRIQVNVVHAKKFSVFFQREHRTVNEDKTRLLMKHN
jgi:uncharacterized protein with FMN-binding domain